MGLQMSQIFLPDFVLQVNVLIIPWHCFQASYARAQLLQKLICIQKVPWLLSGHVEGSPYQRK